MKELEDVRRQLFRIVVEIADSLIMLHAVKQVE